jgi:hypothetical protein
VTGLAGPDRLALVMAAALPVGCATPDDSRNERYLCSKETLPMSLDETERYIEGMCLFRAPGLHDPKRGCDANWSDSVVVGEMAGYRMSRVPYSEA